MVAVTATRGRELDATSDRIDEVNVLKGQLKGDAAAFDEASKFDETKEKETFRNYEDAKDHVKVSRESPLACCGRGPADFASAS
jgi:inositol oxygenase